MWLLLFLAGCNAELIRFGLFESNPITDLAVLLHRLMLARLLLKKFESKAEAEMPAPE